jgi:hypothetical protein
MSIDNPSQILTLLSIAAIIIGVLFWLIDSRLNKVMAEFEPNGGASVRDQLDRIEKKVDAVETKVDGHITWHMNQKGT